MHMIHVVSGTPHNIYAVTGTLACFGATRRAHRWMAAGRAPRLAWADNALGPAARPGLDLAALPAARVGHVDAGLHEPDREPPEVHGPVLGHRHLGRRDGRRRRMGYGVHAAISQWSPEWQLTMLGGGHAPFGTHATPRFGTRPSHGWSELVQTEVCNLQTPFPSAKADHRRPHMENSSGPIAPEEFSMPYLSIEKRRFFAAFAT